MTKINELRKVIEFVNTEIGIYDTEKAEIDKLINEIETEQLRLHGVGCSFCDDCGDKVPKGDNMCGTCYKSM